MTAGLLFNMLGDEYDIDLYRSQPAIAKDYGFRVARILADLYLLNALEKNPSMVSEDASKVWHAGIIEILESVVSGDIPYIEDPARFVDITDNPGHIVDKESLTGALILSAALRHPGNDMLRDRLYSMAEEVCSRYEIEGIDVEGLFEPQNSPARSGTFSGIQISPRRPLTFAL